jgi:hypothetical protein
MHIRFLIVLILSGFLINTNAFAEDALNNVRIVDGINQYRPPNTRQTIGRRYIWNFKGKSYTILMTIDVEKYNSYSGKERYDIPKLVEEGRTTVGNLTREFQRIIRQNKSWSHEDRVDFVLSFVQALPYTLDDVTTSFDEFRRYAIETLIEGGGDCEDTTILVASILRGLGESVALIFTPRHIALGVSGDFTGSRFSYQGMEYYYCETTGTGWTVGVLPASVGKTADAIIPLLPSKLSPEPTTPKKTSPEPVQPAPKPVQPAPKPEPEPIQPTPSTTPTEPEPEKPEDSEKSNPVGMVIATLFILVGIGVPIGYVLYRFILGDRDDDFPDDDYTEYDDTETSALDQ